MHEHDRDLQREVEVVEDTESLEGVAICQGNDWSAVHFLSGEVGGVSSKIMLHSEMLGQVPYLVRALIVTLRNLTSSR